MSCKFIGYSEKSTGYKFYCPNSYTRIQETHNAKFIENTKPVHSSTNALMLEGSRYFASKSYVELSR